MNESTNIQNYARIRDEYSATIAFATTIGDGDERENSWGWVGIVVDVNCRSEPTMCFISSFFARTMKRTSTWGVAVSTGNAHGLVDEREICGIVNAIVLLVVARV